MILNKITNEEEKEINNILDNSINKIKNIKKLPKYSNNDIYNSFQNDIYNNINIRKTYNIESNNNLNNLTNRSFNNILLNNENNNINMNQNNFNFLQQTKNLLSKRASSAHDRLLNIKNSKPNNNKNKTKNIKKNNIDYELKCEKLRNELSKLKNDLVQERLKSSQLIKEYNKLVKKEEIYDKTFEENQNILCYNENLFKKIKESEEIRKEQNLVINSLKLEYNELLQFVNPEKYEKLFLKTESKKKTKKKNLFSKK